VDGARDKIALPAMAAAAVAGSVSAAMVLAAGLLIALVTPDASLIGSVRGDEPFVTEAFRQSVGTLLTPMVESQGLLLASTRRLHPLLFVLIPLTALATMTRWQLHRTAGARPLQRIGWALAVAGPFALWMLLFALIGGSSETTNIDVSAGNAFALAVLWGVLGGLLGAVTKLRPPAPAVHTALDAAQAALRPLAALLLACTAIALVGWLVQVGANAGDVRTGRSAPTALIEETVYGAEHGIHLTALAGGALFRADYDGALGLPFPVDRPDDVPRPSGSFRILAYHDVLPAHTFLPALVVLLGLLIAAGLSAGLAVARAARARTRASGAAWGAITGPVWGITMCLLAVLAGGLFHGDADDASVFGLFLLWGALLGAAGGALAAQPSGSPADSASA